MCLTRNSTTGISLQLQFRGSFRGCCCPGEEIVPMESRLSVLQSRLSSPAVRQHCPAGTEHRNEREMLLAVLWEILEPLFSV